MEFLAFFIILLFGAFILEIILLRKYTQAYQFWIEVFENHQESFDEIRKVVNSNAALLRQAVSVANEHERIVKTMAIVVDIHSEYLKIGKNIRQDLLMPAIENETMDLNDDE